MFFRPILHLFLFLTIFCAAESLFLSRINRHCHQKNHDRSDQQEIVIGKPRNLVRDEMATIQQSKITLFLIFVSALIFLLMFLGVLKGLIGILVSPKIGSYGMHLLIDLPRPLIHYQEKQLQNRTVIYDVGGWPIHPDTYERTVRILPKRTEFCLNLIFFLAYPLAALIFLCGFCCGIKPYNKSNENVCFKKVQVVRLTRRFSKEKLQKDKNNKKDKNDTYKDEEKDTKYVKLALKKSKESLNESCMTDCPCLGGNKIEED